MDILKGDMKNENNDGGSEEENRRKVIIKLVIGSILFAGGIIFKFQNWLELTIFLISYVIVGGNVVLQALGEIS
ncbi:hypothetical protein, partial [Clostridium luticellarii]